MIGEQKCLDTMPKSGRQLRAADIAMPALQPNCYAHMGRAPDTNRHVRALQLKQARVADFCVLEQQEKSRRNKEEFTTKFDEHTYRRRFKQDLFNRVTKIEEAYEEAIEARRERLKEMLAKDERDFYWETIDVAQRGGDIRMSAMKQRAEELLAKREAERLQVVKEKRFQQHVDKCEELRLTLSKKSTLESKNVQLQQMRENEGRRAAEREYDRMWYEISMKEMKQKKERAEQEVLARFLEQQNNKDVWQIQIEGKEILRREADRVKEEDRIEMAKQSEGQRRGEIADLQAKQLKRDQYEKELYEQLVADRKAKVLKKQEEREVEYAFMKQADMQLEKQKANTQNGFIAKQEMCIHRENLRKVKEEREQEDAHLDQLLEEHKKAVQKVQDNAKCKIEAARQKLKEDTIKGVAQQIQYKKDLAEQELKRQQADNELLQLAYDTNERLAVETVRQEREARFQYRDDLLKQIEYNKLLQERERQELEKQIDAGRKQEERFTQMVKDICTTEVASGVKHPFRKVLERYDCHCQGPNAKLPF